MSEAPVLTDVSFYGHVWSGWRPNSSPTQGCHEIFATKFHDFSMTVSQNSMTSILTYMLVGWILKSCCVAAQIHESYEFVCQIPWLFHDFWLQFQNSTTFPWPFAILVKIPWLFHDRGNPVSDIYIRYAINILFTLRTSFVSNTSFMQK